MSAQIDAKKSVILGRNTSSITGVLNDLPVDSSVFRLLIGLSFWAFLGIYTTGFLRPLLTVVSLPLLLLFFLGNGLGNRKTFYLPQLISLGSLIYTIHERSGPLPGVVLLLQFTSIILLLQILLLKSLRSVNGVLILSLMIILAVAAMNVNFLFPTILVPYLLNFFLVLRWISLFRHRILAEKAVKIDMTFRNMKGQLVGFILSAAVFVFVWLVMFYLIPRTESFGLASEASKRRLTGFSDTLSLGATGFLEDNPAVVMRIRPIEEKTISPSIIRRLKSRQLRGTTFAEYSAGRWEKGKKRRWFSDLRRNAGEIQLINSGFSPRDIHPLEIILENTEPPLVFVPDQTAELSLGLPFAGVEEDRTLFFVN
ncbi:MAG: transglutaminaseTgpA domain-containing protein, partial [Candidatus Riflebacteria bacterium]|nr:transglutaminaseTgpA domain-containing protein [Candidatus Riflebacteria bacterium]